MLPDQKELQRGAEALRARLAEPGGLSALNRIFGLISLAVGAAFVLGGGWAVHHFHMDEFMLDHATAQGQVVENRPVRITSSSGARGLLGGMSYRAIVHFGAPDGRELTLEDWISLNPATFGVGQRVTVYYDPEDPQHAMIDRGWKNYLAGIPVLLGLLMILGGARRLSKARG